MITLRAPVTLAAPVVGAITMMLITIRAIATTLTCLITATLLALPIRAPLAVTWTLRIRALCALAVPVLTVR